MVAKELDLFLRSYVYKNHYIHGIYIHIYIIIMVQNEQKVHSTAQTLRLPRLQAAALQLQKYLLPPSSGSCLERQPLSKVPGSACIS